MNSRTIHSVLFVSIVSVFFVTGTHVHAQNMANTGDEPTDTVTSQPTKAHDSQISSQLPIISSDVGESIPPAKQDLVLPDKKTQISISPKPPNSSVVLEESALQTTPEPQETTSTNPTPQSVTQMTNTGGLDPEKLFAISNEYRKSKGLPEFKKDDKTCALASSRAPEVSGEVASGDMHKGLRDRNLDYWNTENIISMRTEESAFNWWVNDKIHHDALIGNFTYSCVACSGNSCAQEFTNYQAK